jgi:hypothetical protein
LEYENAIESEEDELPPVIENRDPKTYIQ